VWCDYWRVSSLVAQRLCIVLSNLILPILSYPLLSPLRPYPILTGTLTQDLRLEHIDQVPHLTLLQHCTAHCVCTDIHALYHIVLRCTILYSAILCFTVLHSVSACCTVLYCTVLYCTVREFAVMCSAVGQCTARCPRIPDQQHVDLRAASLCTISCELD
jgi:hypothetical protein